MLELCVGALVGDDDVDGDDDAGDGDGDGDDDDDDDDVGEDSSAGVDAAIAIGLGDGTIVDDDGNWSCCALGSTCGLSELITLMINAVPEAYCTRRSALTTLAATNSFRLLGSDLLAMLRVTEHMTTIVSLRGTSWA